MDATTPSPEPDGKPKRRPRETRPLKVSFEVVAIDGEEGRKLHQLQSQAVFDALLWLASNPRSLHDPDQRSSRPRRRAIRRDDG